jgi:uncharacterized surface protein with fasciclin (FAS1) repeats
VDGTDLNIIVEGEFPLEAFFVDGGCNRAQIIVPLSNRLAVNGVLHVVDRLILPSGNQDFCPSVCERLELNPLTTVFVAAIYALGLENEYCTTGASNTSTDYEPPRMTSGTIFAPTDLAFAKYLYQAGITVFAIFASYPERLYDTILYHTVEGASLYAADVVDGLVTPTALTQGFPPNAAGHIDAVTSPVLTARRFDSFTLIRKNLLQTALFIEGERCLFNPLVTGADCAGRVIVPDQVTITGAIIHTIDQVLTPNVLTCLDPAGQSGTSTVGIAAEVTYVGPIGCSLFCTGVIARCLPCSPFVAQEIYTSPVDASPLSNFGNVVLTLYVNQIGEVRWGQVPGFSRSKWTGDHAIGPIGLQKAGASIVAQGFLATNLVTFNVIANAIDVTDITSDSSPSAAYLLKIYINGFLKGAAVLDFTSIISLAEIQFLFNELVEHYIIERPLFSIRAANYPGPVVQPSAAGLVNPLFSGSDVELVDASSLDDGDEIWNSQAYTNANETITAMKAIGEEVVTAQTIYYAVRVGVNPIEALLELFDGIDGVGYYEQNGFPDVLATTQFFENCGPIFNQYKDVGANGKLGLFTPCGVDAVYYQPWAGVIIRLSVYGGVEIFPSTCLGQPFGRPLVP